MSEKKSGWMDAGGSGTNWPSAASYYKALAKVKPPRKLTKAEEAQVAKDMLRIKRSVSYAGMADHVNSMKKNGLLKSEKQKKY
jgi:hypothetical protein